MILALRRVGRAGGAFGATPPPPPPPPPPADVRVAVRTLLAASAPVAALVGTRLYPAPRPQSAVLPCLTYAKVAGDAGHDLRRCDGTERSRFQLDCWAATEAEAVAIARAVFAALDSYVGTAAGVRITWAAKRGEQDLSFLEADGTGRPTRRLSLDYVVQHRVPIPAN